MTYYKNQAVMQTPITEFQLNQANPDSMIDSIIQTIFSRVHGFLLITNITSKNRANFYSLKIDQKQIHLVEKNAGDVNTFSYDLDTHNVVLNNRPVKGEAVSQFCLKIHHIFTDLQTKKAFAYEQN